MAWKSSRSNKAHGQVSGRAKPVRAAGRDSAPVGRGSNQALEETAWLAVTVGVKGLLVIEQVVAQAVGLMRRVQNGPNLAFAIFQGRCFSPLDGGHVLAGVQADQVERIAQARVPFVGNMTHPPEITRLAQQRIKAGKGPNFVGLGKALGMAEIGQIPPRQERTEARHGGQDRGRAMRDQDLGLSG